MMNEATHLPSPLRELVAGAAWHHEQVGASDASVYSLTFPDRAGCYLKLVPLTRAASAAELAHESAVLGWLGERLLVPAVLCACTDATARYQLTTALPGVMSFADALRANAAAVTQTLAEGLRQIHRIPGTDCPFDQTLVAKLALARERVAQGLVDADDFEDANQTRTPASVLAELERTRPATENRVFTHGDYCLPNVLVDPATFTLTGLLDWGRAGIADRYQDLGIAVRSIRRNLGDAWVAPFLAAYGERDPDWGKIAYYILLDELF